MTIYSYFTVIVNHDTGTMFMDDGFIGEHLGGNLFDNEEEKWFDPDFLSETGVKDITATAHLKKLVQNEVVDFEK